MRPRSHFWCWVVRISAGVVGVKAVTPVWQKHSVSSSFPLDVILAIFPVINAHSPFESCAYATICFATSTEHSSILVCLGSFSFPGGVVARLSTLDVCGQRETLIIVGCSCQKDWELQLGFQPLVLLCILVCVRLKMRCTPHPDSITHLMLTMSCPHHRETFLCCFHLPAMSSSLSLPEAILPQLIQSSVCCRVQALLLAPP